MNLQTLQKLSENPHYKLSAKQRAELAAARRKPMVEFGSVDRHDNTKPIHSTGRTKQVRTGRRKTHEKEE